MSAGYADAIARFRGLVDPKTGLIQSVQLLRVSERDPRVFMALAEPCDTRPLVGVEAANRGVACSAVPERAIVRACGESIERYCSAIFAFDDMLLASAEELAARGERAIPVDSLYPFAEAQYEDPGFPFESATGRALRWVRGQVWGSAEEVWVPASCVYVPYVFKQDVEPYTHMPISTGLAAGPDPHSCIEKGVLEILERDALMIVWYARVPAPRIRPESCLGISRECDALLQALRSPSSRWYFNLLTLDIRVPIVSAAIIDDDGPPMTSFGIAADCDAGRALKLAMEEALLTRVLVNRSQVSPEGDTAEIRTLRDHLLAHAGSRALRERMAFLTDEGPALDFGEIADMVVGDSLAERVTDAGMEVVWLDVTSPDVAAQGLWTTRALIPGAQPLDNDHRHRYLGGQRLPDVLNPDPHPFP